MKNKNKWNEFVYTTAFIPSKPKITFICEGKVIGRGNRDRRLFRIKIVRVARKSILLEKETNYQRVLVGRTFLKKRADFQLNLPSYLMPKEWINSNK